MDLDTIKIEELVGWVQAYDLFLPQTNKNKTVALKTVKEEESYTSDEDEMKVDDKALLAKKIKNVL